MAAMLNVVVGHGRRIVFTHVTHRIHCQKSRGKMTKNERRDVRQRWISRVTYMHIIHSFVIYVFYENLENVERVNRA